MSLGSRVTAGVGAVLGLVTLVAYLALIAAEGDDDLLEVLPWAAAMGTGLVMASLGVALARPSLVGLAGGLLVLVGMPAIFSVGLPLMVGGVLCLVASFRR